MTLTTLVYSYDNMKGRRKEVSGKELTEMEKKNGSSKERQIMSDYSRQVQSHSHHGADELIQILMAVKLQFEYIIG